ncbi:MAG: DoxX family protein [Nitrososphaera sp.]|nr:DoxX family protein [Nitrososphaera sp.]
MNPQMLMQFGPLPLRVVMATTYLAHRLPSLSDFGRVQGFVGSLGLPPEAAYIVAVLEVGGSIALLLGVLTRITASFFIVFMTSTSLVVKLSRGFVGGFEVDVLLLTMAASLLITGPGRISIEWDVLKRELFPRGRQLVPKPLAKV